MHCALGRPFYGASKMAVTLGREASQSNQARIKVGFHFRDNKSSKTRSKQAYKHKRAMHHPDAGETSQIGQRRRHRLLHILNRINVNKRHKSQ